MENEPDNNPEKNLNESIKENNVEIFDEMNNIMEDDEKNEELIEDLIKQGKYFDVIKYLESKNDNNKNNIDDKDNNNKQEEELVIIPADDISDLHEDSNSINENKDDNIDEIKENNDKINIINSIDNNKEENNNINEIINNKKLNQLNKENTNIISDKENNTNQNNNNIITSDKNTSKENEKIENKITEEIQNNEKNNSNNKEEESISPKDLIKTIITKDNEIKNRKNLSSNSSSKSISLLHLSSEGEDDLEKNNYYEERLKEIQEERKIFNEKNNIDINTNIINNLSNADLLKKELEELNELENNENADLNGIDQMNEMYRMTQEDKLSNVIQEKRREKFFPFYNKANCDIKNEINNAYFKQFNSNLRNFFISSKILDEKTVNKIKNSRNNKFIIEHPKSVFDDLKFEKNDIKNLDFDEYLDDFIEEKNSNNNNNKGMQNNNKKIEKIFLNFKKNNKYKNKKNKNILNKNSISANIQKPKEIYLNKNKKNLDKKNDENMFDINLEEIYNKYKSSIENLEKNDIDLKKFNEFYINNFNKKNEIFNFNDYSIDLDLDDDIKKEIINNKNNTNNNEDKDKDKFYLKINNNKSFNDSILKNYSLLHFINLENNNLSKFPDFSDCKMLYSINLNNNKITKIEKIKNLNFLEKLSLTNNMITSIENCFFNKRLRFLFLGHNKITAIDNISQDIPFIEELILCQNNINYLPEKKFLPYLKFFDLNENKISLKNHTNKIYFICPSLEKILLLGNNLNENGTQDLIKYCPRLKEIDLSFNKYNNMISLVELLSINSEWNNNLEMINVIGNNFFNSNKNKEIFYFLIKKYCPSVKYINNDELKKNKIYNNINNNEFIYKNNFNDIISNKFNLKESYINIYNSHNYFMKYFTSVYFTNKIFDIYNININNNLQTSNIELFLLINKAYYLFKISHFNAQKNISKLNIGFFSYECNFQFSALLTFLYKFKLRMKFIQDSIPIFVKRTLFRRMKIIKIQQQYKLRILRKKLAAIVIPDDEDDHAEDLLDFFNNSNNKEKEEDKIDDLELDKKIEEIGKKIEKNIEKKNINKTRSKNNFLEVIKEEEKEKDFDIQNDNYLSKIPDLDISNDDIKNNEINNIINNINSVTNNIELKTNKENNILNNNFITNINKDNHEKKEKDDFIMKLISDPKYTPNNNHQKLIPIKLSPISNTSQNQNQSKQSSSNIKNNNININPSINYNYNNQKIDLLKKELGYDFKPDKIHQNQSRHSSHKIILKDEKYYGKYVDINEQTNIPKNNNSNKKNDKIKGIKRPESKGFVLPKINNNLNMSTTTLSNDTKSVYSQMTTGKKITNVNYNHKKNKPDEIIKLEKERDETIKRALAEWKFTNKEAEKALINKIWKSYKHKIQKYINSHHY